MQEKKRKQQEAAAREAQLAEQRRQQQQAQQEAEAKRQQQLAAQQAAAVAAQKTAQDKQKQVEKQKQLEQQKLDQQKQRNRRQQKELSRTKEEQQKQQKEAKEKADAQAKAKADADAKAKAKAKADAAAKAKLDAERRARLAQLQGQAGGGSSDGGEGLAKSGTGSGAGGNATSPGYAEKVQRRVRPNIVWSGETAGLETVVSVRCAPTGTLLVCYRYAFERQRAMGRGSIARGPALRPDAGRYQRPGAGVLYDHAAAGRRLTAEPSTQRERIVHPAVCSAVSKGLNIAFGNLYSMSLMTKLGLRTLVASCLIAAGTAHAQLNVLVTGVGSTQFPIATANFANEANSPQQVSAIVRQDLARSGKFTNIDAGGTPVAETDSVDLGSWKAKGADAFVSGSVTRLAERPVRSALPPVRHRQAGKPRRPVARQPRERLAHERAQGRRLHLREAARRPRRIRDAPVVRHQDGRQLPVADLRFRRPGRAHRADSPEPIISPAWSPDGTKVAYVSFEKKKPVVYIHDLPTGKRIVVSNQKGNNSAPAWSPDGRKLAVALSRTGNTQIFDVNADGSGLRRLTQGSSIDTEPAYSPDGNSIYFTSDRGGQPQIYKMPAERRKRRRGTARHFHGQLQYQPAREPGRQATRVHFACRRRLQAVHAGPRVRHRRRA